jgi:hypothetical protein
VPTRKALEILRSAEERMKIAEGRLHAFIERPERQYSPGERAENKRSAVRVPIAQIVRAAIRSCSRNHDQPHIGIHRNHTIPSSSRKATNAQLSVIQSTCPRTRCPIINRDHIKQPCECGHGKSHHHTRLVEEKLRSPCKYPGCKCRDYKLKKI